MSEQQLVMPVKHYLHVKQLTRFKLYLHLSMLMKKVGQLRYIIFGFNAESLRARKPVNLTNQVQKSDLELHRKLTLKIASSFISDRSSVSRGCSSLFSFSSTRKPVSSQSTSSTFFTAPNERFASD